MTIAPTLQTYLADHEVAYDLVPHYLSQSEFARLNPRARHGRFSAQPAAAQPRA